MNLITFRQGFVKGQRIPVRPGDDSERSMAALLKFQYHIGDTVNLCRPVRALYENRLLPVPLDGLQGAILDSPGKPDNLTGRPVAGIQLHKLSIAVQLPQVLQRMPVVWIDELSIVPKNGLLALENLIQHCVLNRRVILHLVHHQVPDDRALPQSRVSSMKVEEWINVGPFQCLFPRGHEHLREAQFLIKGFVESQRALYL